MGNTNLGTKRQCPKCAAKFYDFGVVDPIKCPKCGKTWTEQAAKHKKIKKETPVKVAKPKKIVDDELDVLGMPDDLPDADGGVEEIEPMEDEDVEMTSLQEVEEHEEAEENDSNSDDAEDDMFTDLSGEKLVDDLEDHLDEEEDEDDEDASGDDDDEDEDDDEDDGKRKKKRRR